MKHFNLIRKIAWSFHYTTGLELDDLIAEASLAYCEVLHNYDPKRGKISTYMWYCIHSHLKNYIKEQFKFYNSLYSIEDVDIDQPIEMSLLFESLTPEAQQIAKVILTTPQIFITLNPMEAQKRIKRILKNQGWSWRQVSRGIRDLQTALN